MGNSSLIPCYSQELPSSRNILEEMGIPSVGPVKAARKKWSIATSETISIQPQPLSSDRSSVTEFAVNRSESSTDCIAKSLDRSSLYAIPCSPGRYQRNEAYSRNLKNAKGVNLVKQVRSKSLMTSPNVKKTLEKPKDLKFFVSPEDLGMRLNKFYPKQQGRRFC